nr:ras-GEF domain-containing family member 1C-like [Dasypus novemcinctus]
MPRTLSASDMVTPGSLSPPPTEPPEGKQASQPLLDGAPSSASLDTLIQHLVPTADYYPEKAYIFTFLLSSRLFIEPQELLARVCHLCIEQQQLDKPVLDKARVRKFGPKLLQLLAKWTETFPWDFQEESAIGHLKDIVGRIVPCDERKRHLRKTPQLRSCPTGVETGRLGPGLLSGPLSCPKFMGGIRWQVRGDPGLGQARCKH